MLLLFYRYGHKLTCFYEIWDQGTDMTYSEDNYGIIHYNLTVKPAYLLNRFSFKRMLHSLTLQKYTALQNLLELFSDQGAPFTPLPQSII